MQMETKGVQSSNVREVKWINCAKLVAILAVMTDHTYSLLYTDLGINMLSYFSVSLFILISGILCYFSIKRHNDSILKTFFRLSKKIVAAYLFATLVVQIYIYKYFDLLTYIKFIIGFNAQPPYYYVLLYLQLMLVSKILFNAIERIPHKFSVLWEAGIGIILLVYSYPTTGFTNILNVYGGGGKLTGGICSTFLSRNDLCKA